MSRLGPRDWGGGLFFHRVPPNVTPRGFCQKSDWEGVKKSWVGFLKYP